MKPVLIATLVTLTLASPVSAFGGFPFQMFDLQFPPEGAFDTDTTKRRATPK